MQTSSSQSSVDALSPDQLLSAPPYYGAEMDIWGVVQRRWLPALLTAAAMFAAVFGYTNSQTPRFQAETLILLDRLANLPVLDEGQAATLTRDLSTEIQILRTPALVEEALVKLPPEFQDTTAGQVLSGLNIRQIGNADVLGVSYIDTNPERIKAVLDALGETYVEYSLESQRSQASSAIAFIEEQLPEARQSLEQSTNAIRRFREANSLVDPNTVGQSLVEVRQGLRSQVQQSQVDINRTRQREDVLLTQLGQNPDEFMEESQLGRDAAYQNLVTQLQEAELALALERTRFRDSYPTVQELRANRDQILGLLQERARQVLGEDLSLDATAVPIPSQSASVPLPILQDSLSGEPLSQVGSTQVGQASLPRSSDPAPTATQTTAPLQDILLQQVLQTQVELAVQNAQLDSLQQVETEIAQQFEQIPELQQIYAELQRQNEIESELVNTFLNRLQELRITEAQEVSPWRVLQPAGVPGVPISPNRQRNLALGILAGGLMGVGVAVLLENLDQRIKDPEEAKRLTGLAMLGDIPKVAQAEMPNVYEIQGEPLSTAAAPTHGGMGSKAGYYGARPFTEAFRSMALNIGYLGSSEDFRSICFTSALSGEGKSTITFYLAQALAELGHPVLLVDADMRKPSQHRFIQEPNAVGLSTTLVGEVAWAKALHPILDNQLHILTSGPTPPNPVALLGSSAMSRLMEEWRQTYRYVLIDTPPVIGIADSKSLASQVDGVVMVVGLNRSNRQDISRAMDILRTGQDPLVGMVVNLVSPRQSGYSKYAYYYADPENATQSPQRFSKSGR